jgi:hypothetical protein
MIVGGRIAVEINAAELARSLAEAESGLLGLATIEANTRAQAGPAAARLPNPLGGRVALSALYRVSDMLLEQLPPFQLGAARQPAYGIVRLALADLRVRRAAAAALAQPTGELAALLACCRHDDPAALTRLLSHLRPVQSDTSQLDISRPVPGEDGTVDVATSDDTADPPSVTT